MRFTKKKILINSFILAFIFSFITIYIIFPNLNEFLYTSIVSGGNISMSGWFFVKILAALGGQTSILGGIFYIIAKKIFLKNNP